MPNPDTGCTQGVKTCQNVPKRAGGPTPLVAGHGWHRERGEGGRERWEEGLRRGRAATSGASSWRRGVRVWDLLVLARSRCIWCYLPRVIYFYMIFRVLAKPFFCSWFVGSLFSLVVCFLVPLLTVVSFSPVFSSDVSPCVSHLFSLYFYLVFTTDGNLPQGVRVTKKRLSWLG